MNGEFAYYSWGGDSNNLKMLKNHLGDQAESRKQYIFYVEYGLAISLSLMLVYKLIQE